MEPISNDAVKKILESELDEADISVQGDGYQYQVTVISNAFSGKSTVQRHKLIYTLLNDVISTGRLHALSLKTLTPEETR